MSETDAKDETDPGAEKPGGSPTGGADRRRYLRLPRSSLVTHRKMAFTSKPSSPVHGRIRDLSVTGVRFQSEVDYDLGTLLKLELDLPGWEREKIDFYRSDPGEALKPLVVLAEVRWVKPVGDLHEVGALFVNIDAWHEKALIKYITKLRRE